MDRNRELLPGVVALTSMAAILLLVTTPADAVPAFPEAEGYGADATGGRGGRVIEVTNLDDSGPGSLRAAVEAKEPRIVVFRTSGTIDLESRLSISNPHITIAGQTAPGDGICIKGPLAIGASEVIIRYTRVRADPSAGEVDAITGRYNRNIILDHVSASWSSDEVLSLYCNENVTVQWCMISEACAKLRNGENTGHRFGGIWGNNYGTYHHNLIAHNDSRNPRWASGSKYNDHRNNVIYNWGYQSCYGGEAHGDETWGFFTVNVIANYYKAGPATQGGVRDRIAEPSARSANDKGSWYVADNYVDGYPAVTADNWQGIDGSNYTRLNAPWPAMPIHQQTPEDAYHTVLDHAGCSFPSRDAVDARIIDEVRNGTATYGDNGIITTPSDVGGWPALRGGTAPADSDHDGMPDAWEKAHALNATDPADGPKDRDGDGYTNVEEYLNSLVQPAGG